MAMIGALAGAAGGGLGAMMSLAGTAIGLIGSMQQASAQKAAAEYQAKMEEQKGTEMQAIAQRKAEDKQREADLTKSRQLAVTGASGGGTLTPTVSNLIGETEGFYKVASDSEYYTGQSQRNHYYAQAAATRAKGKDAAKGTMLQGLSGAFSGLAKLYG